MFDKQLNTGHRVIAKLTSGGVAYINDHLLISVIVILGPIIHMEHDPVLAHAIAIPISGNKEQEKYWLPNTIYVRRIHKR